MACETTWSVYIAVNSDRPIQATAGPGEITLTSMALTVALCGIVVRLSGARTAGIPEDPSDPSGGEAQEGPAIWILLACLVLGARGLSASLPGA